jgi:hypothetical protein
MKRLIPLAIVMTATFVVVAMVKDAQHTTAMTAAVTAAPPKSPIPGTSRAELTQTVEEMTARLPNDRTMRGRSCVWRCAHPPPRINNDGRAVITAEEHLRAFLKIVPGNYEAQRTLAAVLLSQHRFAEAIRASRRARALDPRAMRGTTGAMGDGYLELGDYDKAFAAFESDGPAPAPARHRMRVRLYALEITGDLDGALELMSKAAEGTTPNDLESQRALLADRSADAAEGPVARSQTPVRTCDGNVCRSSACHCWPREDQGGRRRSRRRAAVLQTQLARIPTPDLAAAIGDLRRDWRSQQPSAYFAMSEQIERAAWAMVCASRRCSRVFWPSADASCPRP